MLTAKFHKQSGRKRYASTQTSRANQRRIARENNRTCVEAGCSTGTASVSSVVGAGSRAVDTDRSARRVEVPDLACASSSSSRKFAQLAKVAGIAGGVFVDSSSSRRQ